MRPEIKERRFKPWADLLSGLRKLSRDRSGGMLVMVGFLTPVVFGVSALGMDATMWYMQKRSAQTLSDVGAIAGAHAAAQNKSASEVETLVTDELLRNGFVVQPGDTITVNSPPTSGPNAGDSSYVEVVIRRNATLLLASVILDSTSQISVRSVGGSVVTGSHCVVSLDETADQALYFSGTSNVTLDCGVAANSNSSQSIYIDGNAALTADPAQTFGDIVVSSNATLTTNHPVQTYAQKVKDPFGPNGRDLQSLIDQELINNPTCDYNSYETGNSPETLLPGRYCDGLVGKHADHTLTPGVYIVDGGSFSVSGGGGFMGEGVTIILTGSSPADVASVNLSGNGTFDLHAPTTGTWRGILIAQDDKAEDDSTDSSPRNYFKGGSSADLTGAIYLPNQQIEFTGGNSATNQCLQLVARRNVFTGNGNLGTDSALCAALGIDQVNQVQVKLVE